jgi:hypothetical protein
VILGADWQIAAIIHDISPGFNTFDLFDLIRIFVADEITNTENRRTCQLPIQLLIESDCPIHYPVVTVQRICLLFEVDYRDLYTNIPTDLLDQVTFTENWIDCRI